MFYWRCPSFSPCKEIHFYLKEKGIPQNFVFFLHSRIILDITIFLGWKILSFEDKNEMGKNTFYFNSVDGKGYTLELMLLGSTTFLKLSERRRALSLRKNILNFEKIISQKGSIFSPTERLEKEIYFQNRFCDIEERRNFLSFISLKEKSEEKKKEEEEEWKELEILKRRVVIEYYSFFCEFPLNLLRSIKNESIKIIGRERDTLIRHLELILFQEVDAIDDVIHFLLSEKCEEETLTLLMLRSVVKEHTLKLIRDSLQ